jgi:hypothetical protein
MLGLPIHAKYSCSGYLSLSRFATSFRTIACTAHTVPARVEPPEPHPAAEMCGRDVLQCMNIFLLLEKNNSSLTATVTEP